MDQYGMGSSEIQPGNMSLGEMSPKKIVSWSFFALFILAVVVNGISVLIELLVANFIPEIAETDWYDWARTAVAFIVIGFPVYFLMMRNIPNSPKGKAIKIKPLVFIAYFFVCSAAMYITNFFTLIITYFISLIKGEQLINPAADAILNGNYVISLIYAALLAPIFEELIFRKLLLDKLRRFGDIPAILMTGLAFGLFHFNLLQFFYAAVLGFLFAYITIRTNTVIYSIILHMMINFLSTAIVPLAIKGNIIGMMLIASWVMLLLTLGVIIFILNIRKIQLVKKAPVMRISAYFLNPGTILFLLVSVALFTLSIIR